MLLIPTSRYNVDAAIAPACERKREVEIFNGLMH